MSKKRVIASPTTSRIAAVRRRQWREITALLDRECSRLPDCREYQRRFFVECVRLAFHSHLALLGAAAFSRLARARCRTSRSAALAHLRRSMSRLKQRYERLTEHTTTD